MITIVQIGFVQNVAVSEFEHANYPSSAQAKTGLRLRLRKYSARL